MGIEFSKKPAPGVDSDDEPHEEKQGAVTGESTPTVDTSGAESTAVPLPADPVDAALTVALTAAAAAGRFDVVAQLATELQARRVARSSTNVVDLRAARKARGS